jgi:hypothetical protein
MRRWLSHPRLRSLSASASQNAAWGAALALVAIQVGIGLIMKTSQRGGKYAFSPSSSVTISESLKLLLSTGFFWRECKARVARSEAPRHSTLPTSERSSPESKPFIEDPESNGNRSTYEYQKEHVESYSTAQLDLRAFWQYVKSEVSLDVRYGFAQLALFYVLINNMVYGNPRFHCTEYTDRLGFHRSLCHTNSLTQAPYH